MILFARRNVEISEMLWSRLLADFDFVAWRPPDELERLRALCNRFLADKQFAGAHGLMIDDYIGAAIAVQACLPVIGLGLSWYDDFQQIVVYPEQFRYRGSQTDDIGLVHEKDEVLSGQSIDAGPVVLSWADVRSIEPDGAYNVVIHEFTHKLDLRDGVADGVPPMPRMQRARFERALGEAYQRFVSACDEADDALPAHIDPESDAASVYYDHLPLDPYAAEHPSEFFAVCAETLFTDPELLREGFAELFAAMASFFKLDPDTLLFDLR